MIKNQCPKCAEKGKDKSKDNLVVYPDGHSHCFSCNYHTGVTLERKLQPLETTVSTNDLQWPQDFTLDLPLEQMKSLLSYITKEEIQEHKIGWSPTMERIIFPVRDKEGNMLMWQGKSTNYSQTTKYLTFGPKSDIMHIIGKKEDKLNVLVIVEDLLSAIKVGRTYQAMPLWGASMPLKAMRMASKQFSCLGIWLDRDKAQESVRQALRASQFLPTFIISTSFDPKMYSEDVIISTVEKASLGALYGDTFADEPKIEVTPNISYLDDLCGRHSYGQVCKMYPNLNLTFSQYTERRKDVPY